MSICLLILTVSPTDWLLPIFSYMAKLIGRQKEIAELEAEKTQIEELLCSGTLSVDELTEKSKRLPEVNDMIDEKTMRWLELSEIEG